MQKNTITPSLSLPLGSMLLAIAITVVWGLNFIMVKVALYQFQPLTLCALRFLFASIPAIFFIPRPNIPWKYIVGYGLMVFACPFSLLFVGMAEGVTPGIASLILQLQVFFAIFFAYLFAQQNISLWQILGALISFAGIGLIALNLNGSFTWAGFLFVFGAAMCWGLGNIIVIKLPSFNMLALVTWSSFIAFIPVLALAFWLEKPLVILFYPQQLTWLSLLALAYIAYASTLFGYGVWAWLLSKYLIANVAPFTLLCPIFALLCSTYLLGESFEAWKIIAAFLVIFGLIWNVFGQKIFFCLNQCMHLQKQHEN